MLDTPERHQIDTQIEARLRELRVDAEANGEALSELSLADLRAFLGSLPLARRPAIFLLDNGNLRALWKNDAKEQVGLQFLGNGEVQFVIFAQRQYDSAMAREAGTRSLSAIRALVAELDGERLLTG
jgi:hypothetical protein